MTSERKDIIWHEIIDEGSGKKYYYNPQTGESKWSLEKGCKSIPAKKTHQSHESHAGKRYGNWEVLFDSGSKLDYYWNRETKVTQWVMPPEIEEVIAKEQSNSHSMPELGQLFTKNRPAPKGGSLKMPRRSGVPQKSAIEAKARHRSLKSLPSGFFFFFLFSYPFPFFTENKWFK